MDRTLELLKQLAQELLVHSKFEPFVPGSHSHPIDALKTLGKLEQTTQQSIAPLLKQAEAARLQSEAQAQSAALVAENATIAARKSPPRFESRNEYKPALKDPGVVQALLDFHEATAPALASRQSNGKDPQKAPPIQRVPSQNSRGFSPASVQQVDASPKSRNFNPRHPGSSSSVLRKK